MHFHISIEKDGVVHTIDRCISDLMRPEYAQQDIITALNKVLYHVGVPEIDRG